MPTAWSRAPATPPATCSGRRCRFSSAPRACRSCPRSLRFPCPTAPMARTAPSSSPTAPSTPTPAPTSSLRSPCRRHAAGRRSCRRPRAWRCCRSRARAAPSTTTPRSSPKQPPRPASLPPTWRSTASCSSTPRWFPASRRPRQRTPRLQARPTCLSSPTSTPATSATRSPSVWVAPRQSDPCCRASPPR